MRKTFLLLSLFVTTFFAASAKVKLPALVGSNMVLQQKADVRVWGEASPGAKVTISATWSKQKWNAAADKNGSWSTFIKTPSAGGPYDITVSDGQPTVLTNVLIGEVWVCSGQSNMDMPLNGYWNLPIKGSNDVIANSVQNKAIRLFNVKHDFSAAPKPDCGGEWQESKPNSVAWFSATGYNFGLYLNKALNVPVGLISSCWGGSFVEAWMDKETLSQYKDVDYTAIEKESVKPESKPTVLFNAMINPLTSYTIKGVIWYQGESNTFNNSTYKEKFSSMISLWRKQWKQGDFPFFYVEIAPYNYGTPLEGALIREAQYKVMSMLPNVGMASTNDLVPEYDKDNIHPNDKPSVGKRLAYWALAKCYGYEDGLAYMGPSYKSMEVNGSKVTLTFNGAEHGFGVEGDIVGFEVAGNDRVFHSVKASILATDRKILLESAEVSSPVAVRYCFKNYSHGNLYNLRGLPVIPFRTDDWK
ncbi:sialate O-acetylesterase [uncultured Acetobacteroides sp.]|uniref:sialate O-acetylesterase n=1 Tax=uncultured Acetobacteroides sp. TaxID=1760811 RepID=UPI0029F4A973|nr:sialate O-acetylesterase [uncultured Acetobacteroides sp.]